MWATEYCRDEGLRKYWDEYSYPFHKEGDGPLYKGQPATTITATKMMLAITMIARWYDYWRENVPERVTESAPAVLKLSSPTPIPTTGVRKKLSKKWSNRPYAYRKEMLSLHIRSCGTDG